MIVATVLIILITVAAVAIIWIVIFPMVRDRIELGDTNLRFNIVTSGGYTFYDVSEGKLYVQVKRGADESDIVGMDIIVNVEGDSDTYHYNSTYTPGPNQKVTIVIDGIAVKPDLVKVVPVVAGGGFC